MTPPKNPSEQPITLTIVAEGNDWNAPPEVRLRKLIKGMRRAHGFRLISMRTVAPPAAAEPVSRPASHLAAPDAPTGQNHASDGAGGTSGK